MNFPVFLIGAGTSLAKEKSTPAAFKLPERGAWFND